MKNPLRAVALAAALCFATVSAADAQQAKRVYESGTVWDVSYIETKPGMFDDYLAYLNGPWRQVQEARKKAGDVVSYKILAVGNPRDNEPDLVLMVEYKNMAVFDLPDDEIDKQTAEVFGSTVQANKAYASRSEMRAERGGFLARELKFK